MKTMNSISLSLAKTERLEDRQSLFEWITKYAERNKIKLIERIGDDVLMIIFSTERQKDFFFKKMPSSENILDFRSETL